MLQCIFKKLNILIAKTRTKMTEQRQESNLITSLTDQMTKPECKIEPSNRPQEIHRGEPL